MFEIFLMASPYIEQDVGPIVGPIIFVLGHIMSFIMNFVSNITLTNSLGIAIIITTLLIRVLMLPQGLQAMKSSRKMRLIQPEVAKIRDKYGKTKDPELQKKMNAETQELYRKNKINPLGGCLPLLITMPIFIALIDLMRRLPWYITKLRDLYIEISYKIYEIPGVVIDGVFNTDSEIFRIALSKTTVDIRTNFLERYGEPLNIHNPEHFLRFFDKFTPAEWDIIRDKAAEYPAVLYGLDALLVQRETIQTFLGLNLVQNVNTYGILSFNMIVPLLSGGTSFLLSWLSMKMNPPQGDQGQKMQRMMMLIVMPIMMMVFTYSIPGGVGVYWIAGNLIAILQQFLLNKFYLTRLEKRDA